MIYFQQQQAMNRGVVTKLFKRKLASKAERFVPSSGSYPRGFVVGGIHSGVKKDGKSLDLALLKNVHGKQATTAAVFTTNRFKAAPVQASMRVLKNTGGEGVNSIIINSGCANAVTGPKGLKDAESMISVTDAVTGNGSDSSLVMSTGVIGQNLPIDKILTGISTLASDNLGDSHEDWMKCAEAICTTDTFPKIVSRSFEIDGITYTIAGVTKGAGMICPNMATLLSFVATDAPVSASALKQILSYSSERSFNSISVDGDMSTNDTLAAIANGAAGGRLIDNTAESAESYFKLQTEVTNVSRELSKLIVRDGEGATKFITLKVKDALSFKDAKSVASAIANSSLFKTAMYGRDANWGRITAAIGYASLTTRESVVPEKTCVSFVPVDGSENLDLLVDGVPQPMDEARASEILSEEDINVEISLGTKGGQEAQFWTCDLSHEYITINGDYRS